MKTTPVKVVPTEKISIKVLTNRWLPEFPVIDQGANARRVHQDQEERERKAHRHAHGCVSGQTQ